MHASIILAGLAASVVYATPLNAPSGFGGAPTTLVTATAPFPTGASSNGTGVTAPSGSLGVQTATPNKPVPSGFVSSLLTADNTISRFNTIRAGLDAGQIDLKFDFNPKANPGVKPGQFGQVDLAQRGNFPILSTLGISAATVFFEGCGLNTPHIHPRATEFLTLVTPSKQGMLTGFVMENAQTTEFNTTLSQFQGTVFPQGSIHWQQNLDCEPAVAIAGLNSEDPGASSIAQNFLINTSEDIVEATLAFPNQINADNFAQFKTKIPASIAAGVESCLKRCGKKY